MRSLDTRLIGVTQERGRSYHAQGSATVTSTVAVSHSGGSQIRRFIVEYPTTTSFFKLPMADSRGTITRLRAELGPDDRINGGIGWSQDVKDMEV